MSGLGGGRAVLAPPRTIEATVTATSASAGAMVVSGKGLTRLQEQQTAAAVNSVLRGGYAHSTFEMDAKKVGADFASSVETRK